MQGHIIKKISEVDKNELLAFYKLVFKDRYKILSENLEWWYRLKQTKSEPIILTLDQKIIGQLGTIPTKISNNDQIIKAVWYVDYVILPEFYGKGGGSLLVDAGTKNSEVQIAFCNEAALKVYKKFNWNINKSMQRFCRPMNPIKWIPLVNRSETKVIKNFYNFFINKHLKNTENINSFSLEKNLSKITDSFSKRKIDKLPGLNIIHDEEWFNWRFIEFPFRKNLRFFEFDGNFLIAHSVRIDGVNRLNIIFSFYLENSKEVIMYYQVTKWCIENNYDLIWSCSMNKELIKNLSKLFPKYFLKTIVIATHSNNENIRNSLKKNLNNIYPSDSDIDINCLQNHSF
ncbi:MAG: hypothetical protein ACJZ4O_03505 [Pelagibacteraceae bacterium]